MIEELPAEVPEEPEPEPEPEPPRAKAVPRAEASVGKVQSSPESEETIVPRGGQAQPKRVRPKKEPGAPKAKYAPRKRVEPPPQPPPPLDEATVARHVVRNIGQVSRDLFESRRDGWHNLVAMNYQ